VLANRHGNSAEACAPSWKKLNARVEEIGRDGQTVEDITAEEFDDIAPVILDPRYKQSIEPAIAPRPNPGLPFE